MPLILAVNPAGIQSPTLARLARELKGCDLVGAESYAVAIQAFDQHAPDLVLLPDWGAKGERELMARLSMAPGIIPTLKLPPPAALDFNALLAEVKALLAKSPVDVPEVVYAGASPYLVAAATAAIEWIRARRTIWAFNAAQERAVPELDAPWPLPEEPAEPSVFPRAADAAGEWRDAGVAWLPRVAALALLIALVSASIFCWPSIRGAGTSAHRAGRTNTGPAADSALRVPGWLAVFSPFEMSISEGNRPIVLDDRSRVMLPPGPHSLRFRNKALGYDNVRTVQIRPTETTTTP